MQKTKPHGKAQQLDLWSILRWQEILRHNKSEVTSQRFSKASDSAACNMTSSRLCWERLVSFICLIQTLQVIVCQVKLANFFVSGSCFHQRLLIWTAETFLKSLLNYIFFLQNVIGIDYNSSDRLVQKVLWFLHC